MEEFTQRMLDLWFAETIPRSRGVMKPTLERFKGFLADPRRRILKKPVLQCSYLGQLFALARG